VDQSKGTEKRYTTAFKDLSKTDWKLFKNPEEIEADVMKLLD